MAEEEVIIATNHESDADFDYTCTPCRENEIMEQAIKYCPACQEYLCTTCTRHHGLRKATESHKLLDSTTSTEILKEAMAAKCRLHQDLHIEKYCWEHDMVLCTECIALEHRARCRVTGFEELRFSSNQKSDIEHLKRDTRNIQKRLKDSERKTQMNIDSIKEERGDVISQLEELERDLIEHIRQLKYDAMQTLETEYRLVKEELESKICIIDQAKQNVEEASWKLQKVDKLDINQQFIQSKLAQKTVNNVLNVLEQCEAKGFQSISFQENTDLKCLVTTTTTFGNIQKETKDDSLPKMSKRYKVKSQREFNISAENERHDCYVTDICQLADNTIILIDSNNRRVKRLDVNYKMKDYFDLGDNPTGICCTGDTEFAVKLSSNKVQFMSVESSFTMLRDIPVPYGSYYGMTYCTGELWISAKRGFTLYSKSGTPLESFRKDVNGQCMPESYTQQMAVSGDTIIVADGTDGAVCLRRNGTVKRELRSGRLENTCGVCISSDGTVFIAGYNSHNIVMFDNNGKCLGELIDKDFGMVKPRSLLYDESRNCLVVGCTSKTIKVYNI